MMRNVTINTTLAARTIHVNMTFTLNQFGFGLGGGNGLLRETRNLDEIRKVSTEQFRFTLGLTPGITFFAVENFAFEVGINVLGYELRRIETITDEVETSVDTRHNVNLKLNLLSLNIGLAYYFL